MFDAKLLILNKFPERYGTAWYGLEHTEKRMGCKGSRVRIPPSRPVKTRLSRLAPTKPLPIQAQEIDVGCRSVAIYWPAALPTPARLVAFLRQHPMGRKIFI